MKLLIDAGADLNVADERGLSALQHASYSGNKACLEALIDAGANVNARGKNGNTALHQAAYFGKEECLKLLINPLCPLLKFICQDFMYKLY